MIHDVLKNAYKQLQNIPTNRLDAQILLCHVLGVDKPYLIAHDDRMLNSNEKKQFQALIERRASGEPVAYIVGMKHFWDLELIVTPSVLIPRPETEHLIEAALSWLKVKEQIIAVDIGTGSGAIAVTVAKHTEAKMFAVDISADALSVAQQNARKHEVDIQFYQGSLAQALISHGIKVDLLMANLPYIRSDEMTELAVSKHEPQLALDGGDDGLDLVRDLLLQVPEVCKPGALILLEIGMEQGQAVIDFARKNLTLSDASIIKDLAGLDRIVRLELS